MNGSTLRLKAVRKRELATLIRNGRMESADQAGEANRLLEEARALEGEARIFDGKSSFHFHAHGLVARVNVLDSAREYERACDDVMCPHADADLLPAR